MLLLWVACSEPCVVLNINDVRIVSRQSPQIAGPHHCSLMVQDSDVGSVVGPRLDIRSAGFGSGTATATFSNLTATSLRGSGRNGGDRTLTSCVSRTRKSASQEEVLVAVLDDMRLASPPVPFARNYLLLSERASGGQGVVQVRPACVRASRA